MHYEAGSRVTYRTTDGDLRTVTVTAKEDGGTFLGTCKDEEGYPVQVWGYEADIVKVH